MKTLLAAALLLNPFVPHGQPHTLHWAACHENRLASMQCADLKVPLDHAHPHGRMITIALSMARHTGPAKSYQGVLLVNPGGPGGAGRPFAAEAAQEMPTALRRAYDVVGFDPRGVAASRPALSCEPDFFKPVRPDYVPTGPAAEQTWLNRSRAYAQACGRKYGSLLRHMKTTDTVADMDDIRRALGQAKINYYGASYGTYLGAVYATLHPGQVRRMVLDSNVRPSGVWYGDNIDQDYAFDMSVKAFFGWIADHHDVYGLGSTEQQVRAAYYALRAHLKTHPAGGIVGPDELDDTVQLGGYLAPAWPGLADAWAQYAKGDPSRLIARFKSWGASDENEYAVYSAVQCTDAAWPKWPRWESDAKKIYATAPYMAWSNTWYNAPCLSWPAPAGKPVKIGAARNLPHVLLFQATLDSATPFSGGLEMHRLMRGSHLVIEDGGRTHAVVERGNKCIDTKFFRYLATGRMPADMSHCARLPDPVPVQAGGGGARVGDLPAFRLIR